MAGVGKLLKQAQKMQKKMETVQEALNEQMLDVSAGGGAVSITISGQCEIKSLKLDPEFLKEDAEMVQDTIMEAVNDAMKQANELRETEMNKVTEGFNMPGLM